MNENLGGLDEVNETEEKVVEIEKKRKPFHYWTVAGRDYKLKLQAGSVERVENKYHQNIINMIDEIPPLSVMLTIIQAAMENWEHNMSYTKIKKLYDTWTRKMVETSSVFIQKSLSLHWLFRVFSRQSRWRTSWKR